MYKNYLRPLLFSFLILFSIAQNSLARGPELSPGQTYRFDELTDCDFTEEDGTIIEITYGRCVPPRRLEVAAVLPITAINLDATAYAIGFNDFSVSSTGDETVLGATVSGELEWDGVLFGAGLLDAGANVQLVVKL